jgi:hypothetical protein
MAADDDRKVKDMLDPQTRADLERWFALPSFEQVADSGAATGPPDEDPEIAAVRERREKAIAAVDPQLLAAHIARMTACEDMAVFAYTLETRVDPDMAMVDRVLIDRQIAIADPREIELPPEMEDDLRECAPQAILRDLHRPEVDFEKTFEIVDVAAEQRLDIVAEVSAAMATSWRLPELPPSPFVEGRALLAELRAERRQPWPKLLATANLPNRRVEPLS